MESAWQHSTRGWTESGMAARRTDIPNSAKAAQSGANVRMWDLQNSEGGPGI
jgi:hypothetical protein